ncbi:MAG: hypothetical protein EOL87_04320 [Spartobacteria bacterium]|nr:hypothetical protein [Spartobacteria bacterium]
MAGLNVSQMHGNKEHLVHPADRDSVIWRVTALWALCEAGLGGVIHAMRIPFTGIVVGASAVIMITLLAYYSKKNTRIMLRAMGMVLVIKMTVSPHTPFPAYLAVTLQGLAGVLLFRSLPGFRIPAFLLGCFAMMEGVVQKFTMMTLLYGKSIWESMDVIYARLLHDAMGVGLPWRGSVVVLCVYGIYYGVGGCIIGWLAGSVPEKIEAMRLQCADNEPRPQPHADDVRVPFDSLTGKPRNWVVRRLLPSLMIFLLLVVASWLFHPEDRWSHVFYVIVRTALAYLIWFALLHPLLRRLIRRTTATHAQRCHDDLVFVQSLFPSIRMAARQAWQEAVHVNRRHRWSTFMIRLIYLSLER